MDVLRRLLTYVRPYWRTLVGVSALLLMRTGLSLLPPLVQREVVDRIIADRDPSGLLTLIAILIAIHALARAVDFGEMYFRHVLGERFIFDLRVCLYDHVQR
ncbi:MAG: hypothetical protein PVH41_08415, partial [Anaerolineae bacterium]